MSRPPSPTPSLGSDEGCDSCDEVEEGIFREDEWESDGEMEDNNELENEIIAEVEEEAAEGQKAEKGKGKEVVRGEEDVSMVEGKPKEVANPTYIRVSQRLSDSCCPVS